MKTWKWNQFGKLSSLQNLEDYFACKPRQYNHSNFFHYTTAEAVESILKNKRFWLTNVQYFNDIKDSAQFPNSNDFFALCLSSGIHENLPMWYLYAGITGTGVRLQIKKNDIICFVEKSTYHLCRQKKTGNDWQDPTPIMELKDGETMCCTFRDILYSRDEGEKCSLKYNTMTNYNLTNSELEAYKNKHIGFSKELIWFYEKETRLLVQLTGKAKKYIEQNPETDATWRYLVTLDINESVANKLEITFAPNITQDKLDKKLNEHPEIKKFCVQHSPLHLSDYAEEVDINPCQKCTYFLSCSSEKSTEQ
jgi:hypothetical protein